MLPKICENLSLYFSENLRVVALKLLEATQFASPNLSISLILYGVNVRCDRGGFSVHSPFIEKSMEFFLYVCVYNRASTLFIKLASPIPDVYDFRNLIKVKSSLARSPASGESTTTECEVNYQLLAVIYRSSKMVNSQFQSTTTSYGQCRQRRQIQLTGSTPTLMGSTPRARCSLCSIGNRPCNFSMRG